jgi:hypothetical protein
MSTTSKTAGSCKKCKRECKGTKKIQNRDKIIMPIMCETVPSNGGTSTQIDWSVITGYLNGQINDQLECAKINPKSPVGDGVKIEALRKLKEALSDFECPSEDSTEQYGFSFSNLSISVEVKACTTILPDTANLESVEVSVEMEVEIHRTDQWF